MIFFWEVLKEFLSVERVFPGDFRTKFAYRTSSKFERIAFRGLRDLLKGKTHNKGEGKRKKITHIVREFSSGSMKARVKFYFVVGTEKRSLYPKAGRPHILPEVCTLVGIKR